MKNYVTYESAAPYWTLHELDKDTTDIWVVFHGFGQLAERFIRKFEFLPKNQFVIAPQGMSRFYFDDYKKVGASWMTRMEKDIDLANQQSYLKKVTQMTTDGQELNGFKLNVFAFSQGVSTACRWIAHEKVAADNLILWAGGFPMDLEKEHFNHLDENANLQIVYGENDEYLTDEALLKKSIDSAEQVLNRKAKVITFPGGHRVDPEVLRSIEF